MHLWSVLGTQAFGKDGYLISNRRARPLTIEFQCKRFLLALATILFAMLRAIFVSWPAPAGGSKQRPGLLPQLPKLQCKLPRSNLPGCSPALLLSAAPFLEISFRLRYCISHQLSM